MFFFVSFPPWIRDRSPANFEVECRTTSILSRFAIVAKEKGKWGKSEQKTRRNRGERNVKDRSFWNENRPVEPTPLPPFYSFLFLVSHKRTCFKLELSRNEFAYVTVMEQLSRDRPFDPLCSSERIRSFYLSSFSTSAICLKQSGLESEKRWNVSIAFLSLSGQLSLFLPHGATR